MGWLTANVTDRATPNADGRTADAGRRDRFLAATRPALDRAYRLAGLLLGNAHEADDAVALTSGRT
jgi:DNA-directed RNA polymerase specialized sigma24 family protein